MANAKKTPLIATVAAIALSSVLVLPVSARDYFFGADLSYVNEMKDCGAVYKYQGVRADPYHIFAETGTNLVRVRLWNNPKRTKYSNLADATKAIRAARAEGMKVLLDFHYSDDWADGGKQVAPAAWANMSEDEQVRALHDFTVETLNALKAEGLMPDMVQVGNETNVEIVSTVAGGSAPINWKRNARLLNAGISAVREAGRDSAIKPLIMLHVAQPENVMWWFDAAIKAGVTDFDIIGLSYYSKWSKEQPSELGATIARAHARFGKEVMVVETAYAFTDGYNDDLPNLLGQDTATQGYPISPQGQALYIHDLMQLTLDNGGLGVVYWEPAWVSTKCRTPWGQGSSWENATFFDFKGQALPALEWPKASYVWPVAVTFIVHDHGQASQFLSGDFADGEPIAMARTAAGFSYTAWLRPGSSIVFGISDSTDTLDAAPAQEMMVPENATQIDLK